MMKFVVTLSLLLSMFSSMACGLQGDFEGSDAQKIEAIEGSSVSSLNHKCPDQDSDPHHDSPCGDHCHHHGHCHCGFLVNGNRLHCPTLESRPGLNTDSFHPDPHVNNLFRPPIV
jgi:hypothetical protein